MVTRRKFLLKFFYVIAAFIAIAAKAATQISFKATVAGTVLVNTIKKYPTWVLSSGYVYKVSSLSGRIIYKVNGILINVAAGKYTVAKGATITWKQL